MIGEGTARTVVRAPNHLGDVVAALPALLAAVDTDAVVVRWLAPLLELAGFGGRVHRLDRGWRGFRVAVGWLRAARYEQGLLLSPSFSAAWLFRWGGVRRLRGTATDGRGFLLAERVDPTQLRGRPRIEGYRMLMGQAPGPGSGPARLSPPEDVVSLWRERLSGGGPLVGMVPGSHAPARRWRATGFGAVARNVLADGGRVVLLGGPSERSLTSRVAADAPGAVDTAGETGLVDLVAVISLCDVLVTNDTGPMHLAAAVGTPTVTLWGPSDPAEAGPVGVPDIRVTSPALPCKPCFRNECPRRGAGTVLDDAHEECMRLIDASDVTRAVGTALEGRAHG